MKYTLYVLKHVYYLFFKSHQNTRPPLVLSILDKRGERQPGAVVRVPAQRPAARAARAPCAAAAAQRHPAAKVKSHGL